MPASWQALYASDDQGLWALIVVPAAFLVWRLARPQPRSPGAEPRAAGFVRAWALVFAVLTIADPVVTGPVLRALGLVEHPIARGVLFTFVFLGDLRVFLLVLGVASPGYPLRTLLAEATLWTLVVPTVATLVMAVLPRLLGPLPGMTLWLVYEIAFTGFALVVRERLVPGWVGAGRPQVLGCLRALLAYVVVYYVLWAAADVLILLGRDVGWALRMIPNQLYYAFWVPFAYGLFFSRRYASTSRSTQAAR